MKQVKSYNIFDSTELTDQEILEGYKKAEPSIKALRITELSFWITIFIVTIALDLYFSEGNGHGWASTRFFIMLFSIYYIGHRIGSKDGFKDGYEFGWSEGVKNTIKNERNLSDEEFANTEEMDFERKHGI